jgi:radical SAM superfamily enzyme YgiQ (UPF0313 family)
MRAILPLVPVFNHRLGLAYVTAILRRDGHEVVPIDFEHLLWFGDRQLSLDLQDETEVYADRWSAQIQYFHRPELLCGAIFADDPEVCRALRPQDVALIERLRPHVRRWADAILAFEPDVLLLPALVSNLWIVLWLAAEIHARAPEIVRIVGGRGVTYAEVRELVLRAGWVDGVLAGEAESSVGPLMAALARGERDAGIPGYCYVDGDRIVSAPAAGRVDLDALPLPDLDGLPFPGATLRLYSASGREFHDAASLATSRWCPYRCAYCYESISPKNYRLRSLDSVLDEIEAQHERLRTPRLFFCDSTLNVSPPFLRGLAERMTALPWRPQVVFAHCEPTRLDRDLLATLRAAGFEKLNFGVEALDARTLARMERRPGINEMHEVFTAAVESGVSLGLNVIANYPGETDGEFRTTLAGVRGLAERLRAASADGTGVRLMVSQARVDPHSALFVHRERFGIEIRRRPLPVPQPLDGLRRLLESMALEWTDGTPEHERRTRFSMLRQYAESLSWPARPARRLDPDARVAIDPARVPGPLAPLVPSLAPDPGRADTEAPLAAFAGDPA